MVDCPHPDRLAQVIDGLRKSEFPTALSAWLAQIVPYNFTVIFGYHFDSKPLDLYDDFPSDRRRIFVSDYTEGPYLLDPFYQSAIRPVAQGVYRLRDFAPDRFYQGEYFRTYYQRTEIAEELGFFAHVAGDCQIVLSLMRQERSFSGAEFRKLSSQAPVVCALLRQHWSKIASAFAARGAPSLASRHPSLLTPREREIVGYILKGHSSDATAEALAISSGTVRIHRRNIYAKLGISSQRELFARYLGAKD